MSAGEGPDVAIFYDGFNDVMVQCETDTNQPSHYLNDKFAMLLDQAAAPKTESMLYNIFFKSTLHIASRLAEKLLDRESTEPEKTYDCDTKPEKAKKVAQMLVNNWRMADALMTRMGKEFYGFLQPASYFGSPQRDYLIESKLLFDYQSLDRQFMHVYSHVQQLIAAEKHGHFVDLSQELNGNTPNFFDSSHINSAGNKVIAQEILNRFNAKAESVVIAENEAP